MNISALFIHRPAGTTLLTIALALAGLIAYQFLRCEVYDARGVLGMAWRHE